MCTLELTFNAESSMTHYGEGERGGMEGCRRLEGTPCPENVGQLFSWALSPFLFAPLALASGSLGLCLTRNLSMVFVLPAFYICLT